MVRCRLYLFGAPRLEHNGQPLAITLRKALAIFVYLAVTRQPHSRDTLATLFWPEKDQSSARGNLRRTLYDLGQLLGQPLSEQLLLIEPERIRLRADAPLWVDLEQFQRCLTDHLPAVAVGQAVTGETLLAATAAADLYTDHFLAGFTLPDCPAFAEWLFFRREELRQACIRLLQQLGTAYAAQEKLAEAIRYARHWVLLDPLEETAHRQLMQLYAQAGQQAAALRQYEECTRLLAEEIDAVPAAETVALYEAIRIKRLPPPGQTTRRQGGQKRRDPVAPSSHLAEGTAPLDLQPHPVTPPSDHPLRPALHNFPPQTASFVGREQEVADLMRLLHDPACRLLTLVGPGGIGKTRLAIEAAQRIVDGRLTMEASATITERNLQSAMVNRQFADGVFFVPLQAISAPDGIMPVLADALGLQFHGNAPLQQQLLHFLQPRQLLLVLDNFEHLLAGAELLTQISAGALGVTLLVTSREALKLQEEWFYPLAGLRLPPLPRFPADRADDTSPTQASFAAYDAVQLFTQAARRAVVAFQPEAHQEQIIRICQLVDGMPLALELAAGWLKVLSCTQIAQEIERGLEILTARQRNVPERQRSMRAIFDQTWVQCTAKEQQVLAALSVFRGGFQEAAAATVAGATPLLLAMLVDRGLLQVESTASPFTYKLHELIRQYAAGKLQEHPGHAAQVAEQHCRYYAGLLRRLEPAFRTADSAAAYQEMQREWSNIVVAWDTAVAHSSVATIDGFVNSLGHFHQLNNWFADGCQRLQPAITRLQACAVADPAAQAVLAKLLSWQGDFYLVQDRAVEGEARLQTALELAQQADQPVTQARALGKLADAAHARKDQARAQALAQAAATIYQQMDDEMGVAWILIRLGKFALDNSDYPQARDRFLAALQLCRKHRFHANTSITLGYLGRLALQTGAAEEAGRYFHEALAVHDLAAGHYFRETLIQGLGAVAEAQGDYQTAQHYYEQSLAYCRKSSAPSDVAYALISLGKLARKAGDYAAARRYLQEALQIQERVAEMRGIADIHYQLGLLAQSERDYATAEQHYHASL